MESQELSLTFLPLGTIWSLIFASVCGLASRSLRLLMSFLPVTLARVCQLLIYDLMSLVFTPFDCGACAFFFFFGFLRLQPDWLGLGPMCSTSDKLQPKRVGPHLLQKWLSVLGSQTEGISYCFSGCFSQLCIFHK